MVNKKAQRKKTVILPSSLFSKKAQIKIQQMIFMLMAIFILFVLIGLIALSSKLSNLKKTATELEGQNALTLVSHLANSPEFYCGNSYGNQKSDCVDLDKVMALKENIGNYNDFWGVSNIEIRKIPNSNVECTDENYPECDYIDLFGKGTIGISKGVFVSICYKKINGNSIANKCDIGKIIVSYEAVQ